MPAAAPPDASPQVLVIEPPRGWPGLGLVELWRHRDLLTTLLQRDLRVRYRSTVLGAAWALVRPLATLAAFAWVVGRVAPLPSEGAPYPWFAFAGLLPWTYCASALGGAGPSLVNASGWVRKVWFPRLALPLASLGAASVDLLVGLALLLPLLAADGRWPGASLLLLPVALLWLTLATAALGVLLAALTARWRDVVHALPFLLQLGLFLTPVLYPRSALPAPGRDLAALNPLAGPVEALRSAVLGVLPDPQGWALSLGAGLALGLVALLAFRAVERRLVDLL